jgi:hypothetical protein
MNRIYLLVTCFCSYNFVFSQNCNQFGEGTFKIDIGFGNMTIERKDNFQLERSESLGILYLQKIEPISECEYIVKRYKVLKKGKLPEPNMSESLKVQIYKVENEIVFFHSQLIGLSMNLDGKFFKISNSISKEFEEIIKNEIR